MTNGALKKLLAKYPDDVLVFIEAEGYGYNDINVILERAYVARDGSAATPRDGHRCQEREQLKASSDYVAIIVLQQDEWNRIPPAGYKARKSQRAATRSANDRSSVRPPAVAT